MAYFSLHLQASGLAEHEQDLFAGAPAQPREWCFLVPAGSRLIAGLAAETKRVVPFRLLMVKAFLS